MAKKKSEKTYMIVFECGNCGAWYVKKVRWGTALLEVLWGKRCDRCGVEWKRMPWKVRSSVGISEV